MREIWKKHLKKYTKNKYTNFALSFICFLYIKFVFLTSKKVYSGEGIEKLRNSIKNKQGTLLCLWHSRVLMSPAILIKIFKDTDSEELYHFSSQHSDGIVATNITSLFGYKKLFASSNNKNKPDKKKASTSAIRNMIKEIKNGGTFAVTPDGPRGPAREINGDLLNIAKISSCPVFPISISYSRKKILNSWDSFQIALPFSKIILEIGEPIFVSKDDNIEEKNRLLKKQIDLLTNNNDNELEK